MGLGLCGGLGLDLGCVWARLSLLILCDLVICVSSWSLDFYMDLGCGYCVL